MENNTAKHFVLQLGSLVSLYLSLSFLLVLLFGLINLTFADSADMIWQIEGYNNSVRLGIAMVIVFFPTYILLTRRVNEIRRSESDPQYLGLTKWLIYLSLLVGGLALLIDLVVVIMTFLEGDITTRFILKALSLLVVIGAAFYYYLLDSKGYWLKNERGSIIYAGVAGVVVLASVIFGFTHIDSPSIVREQKIDQTQIQDLQNIQWQIQDYISINGGTPLNLQAVADTSPLPTAPEERSPYTYRLTTSGFALCAEFKTKSEVLQYGYYEKPYMIEQGETPTIVNPDNWTHDVGEVCFERVVK